MHSITRNDGVHSLEHISACHRDLQGKKGGWRGWIRLLPILLLLLLLVTGSFRLLVYSYRVMLLRIQGSPSHLHRARGPRGCVRESRTHKPRLWIFQSGQKCPASLHSSSWFVACVVMVSFRLQLNTFMRERCNCHYQGIHEGKNRKLLDSCLGPGPSLLNLSGPQHVHGKCEKDN